MAIAFRDSSTAIGGSTPLPISKPAAVVDNDLMLMFATIDDSGGAVTTPTGWAFVNDLINGDSLFRTYLFRKVASGEGSSYDVPFTVATTIGLAIVAWSGVDTTTPVETHDRANVVGSATPSSPSIVPGVNDCMIVGLFSNSNAAGGDTGTPDTSPSATERLDYSDTGALFIRHYIEEFQQTTAASVALDFTNSISRNWTAWAVALRTASAAPTVSRARLIRSRGTSW